MVINFLYRLFGKNAPLAKVFGREQHSIHSSHVNAAAYKTVMRLQQHGHQAFVVGGAVRDLIHGLNPKDFDVATGASPQQVRSLFRNSRIIGRRFPIVHVIMGQEIIEVTTFRSDDGRHTDEQGRILRDASFGTLEEDARRRDFTVNALYYNPTDETVLDFFRGVDDLRGGKLRMIGEVKERYREDPVRILRAIRLAAKLNLQLTPALKKPMKEMMSLLKPVSQARVFDELVKMLTGGHALDTVVLLLREKVYPCLLPHLEIDDKGELGPIGREVLHNTDARVRGGKTASLSFILAALLWIPLERAWRKKLKAEMSPHPALSEAVVEVLNTQAESVPIPQRLVTEMRQLWDVQIRLERNAGKAPLRLLQHPRFRAAYDFLLLRARADKSCEGLAKWWTKFSAADEVGRVELLAESRQKNDPHRGKNGGGRLHRRRKRPPAVKVL